MVSCSQASDGGASQPSQVLASLVEDGGGDLSDQRPCQAQMAISRSRYLLRPSPESVRAPHTQETRSLQSEEKYFGNEYCCI